MLLPTVQSNSIGNAAELAFGGGAEVQTFLGTTSATKIATGVAVVVMLGFIIFGGVKRIAHFTQVVVPFMALAYIAMALIVILLNVGKLPGVIALIFSDIMSPMAMFGGAIFWGVKRGVYSNEAGQGTGPHAAAAVRGTNTRHNRALCRHSPSISTHLLVCSATAFMILITGSYHVTGVEARGTPWARLAYRSVPAATIIDSPGIYTTRAVDSVFNGGFGKTCS